MSTFEHLTDEQARRMTRGELLDRCGAEQQYWLRKARRGMTAADVEAEREFYRILYAHIDITAALRDARELVEGKPGAGGYWDERPDHSPEEDDPECE